MAVAFFTESYSDKIINFPVETQNISGVVRRARDLLRSNTASVSSNVSTQLPKRRRLTHSYEKAPKKKDAELKTLEITCLDYVPRATRDKSTEQCDTSGPLPDYSLTKDDVLFSGTVDLMTNDTEESLRCKVCEVLSIRLARIQEFDFDFVKVSRKTVSTPVCSQGQKWDFTHVKVIAGQGKLYVRLNKPKDQLITKKVDKDESEKVHELSMMFPTKSRVELERVLSQNLNDIHSAIADLLDDDDTCVCNPDIGSTSKGG